MLAKVDAKRNALVIFNIIDKRKRPYRWKQITAIAEPTCNDNSVKDSDQAESPDGDVPDFFVYDDRAAISLPDAIQWAHSLSFPVTLHLYDLGEGIKAAGKLGDLIEQEKKKK